MIFYMRYVIIGNGTAAVGAVEGIRQIDKEGQIILIFSEPHHTYSRPLISYLLQGKIDIQKMKYRPDDFYEKNGCETLPGKTALSVDANKKTVKLDDGAEITYDKLLIATGSRPFIPPTEGLDDVLHCFTFMTLDEAKRLESTLKKTSRVLIVGAGLIGLKCAEGIKNKVSEVTVIDLSPRILPSILDEEGASLVQKHIEAQGIRFLLGQSVKRFDKNTALLSGGETVPFDCLVIAAGVRPNTELVSAAGGAVNRGIVTDCSMLTSLPDVYAAGDCTESFDVSCKESRILALLPNAYMQGECAGLNMAGQRNTFDKAVAMNAIGFFGLHVLTAGAYDGDTVEVKNEGTYKKLFYKDGLLRGYILIGDTEKAGIYTSLIRNQTPLDDIDFELICKKPSLMAFSKKFRCEKLGGVV